MRDRKSARSTCVHREAQGDRRDTSAEPGVVMAELDDMKLKAMANAHLTDFETTFPGQGVFAFCTAMTVLRAVELGSCANRLRVHDRQQTGRRKLRAPKQLLLSAASSPRSDSRHAEIRCFAPVIGFGSSTWEERSASIASLGARTRK